MIELTKEQMNALDEQTRPLRLLHPRTRETYILVRQAEYERLQELPYDDGPWTDEEMDLLAAEVDVMLDDDMAIEDSES